MLALVATAWALMILFALLISGLFIVIIGLFVILRWIKQVWRMR